MDARWAFGGSRCRAQIPRPCRRNLPTTTPRLHAWRGRSGFGERQQTPNAMCIGPRNFYLAFIYRCTALHRGLTLRLLHRAKPWSSCYSLSQVREREPYQCHLWSFGARAIFFICVSFPPECEAAVVAARPVQALLPRSSNSTD